MFYFQPRMIENKSTNLSTQEGREININPEKQEEGITKINAENIQKMQC